MHSVLFRLGDFALHSYGLCMAAGILLAYAVLLRLGARAGRSADTLGNLVVLLVLSGLAGARLFYVVEHASWYRANPLSALRIWEGGLVFYGSIVVSGVVLAGWCAARRCAVLPLLDLFAAVVPLGQAFGRLGCFLNGCCWGRVADTALSVRYPAGSIPWREQVLSDGLSAASARSLPVLPTQLFEAAGCLVLGAALVALHRRLFPPSPGDPAAADRSPFRGLVFAGYLAGYGLLRFGMETLRADERAHPFGGPFSIAQCISLGCLLLAILCAAAAFVRFRRSRPARSAS